MSFPIVFAAGVIIIGLLMLIKALVPSFQFSTFKFIVGIIIIIFGINILFSSFGDMGNNTTLNNSSSGTKQSVVFSERTIYISDDMVGDLNLECAFASLTVYIPKDKNISITSSSAFGSINMPNGNSVSFGTLNESTDTSGEVLNLKINCAFGSVDVKYTD